MKRRLINRRARLRNQWALKESRQQAFEWGKR